MLILLNLQSQTCFYYYVGLDLPSQLNQWLSESSDTAWRSPIRLIVVVLMVVSASSMLLLLLWMVVTPFAHGLTNETLIPLFSKQIDWESQNASVKREHLRQRYADQPIGSAKEEIMCASEVSSMRASAIAYFRYKAENHTHMNLSSSML